ncbi:S8 family serine peptidase [Halobellus sp. MBLA0160]|uniref:S8 family serine peptidase n=1 Tax=Halobellus ruber TaxID=2761102 RepID=A0A7J9SP39_9EURY|nr:S8 family serine peptidase [Halobellus ruber]
MTRRHLEAVVLAAVVVTAGTGVYVVDRAPTPTATFVGGTASGEQPTRPSVPTRIRALHQRGITGANATVGIVVVTRINADHPELRPRIVERRSFRRDPAGQPRGRHGTAAALTVAAIAPDAELLVATVDTPTDARRAIEWLTARGTDVLLVPATVLGAPGDGTGTVASAVERAADRGTVVVAPTGNLARNHWQGRLTPTRRGLHSFGGDVRMRLLPPVGAGTQAGGRVQARLRWNGSAYPRDLTLELYRSGASGVTRIATSERTRTGSVRVERLDARVRPGDLFVAVRLPNRTVRRFEPLPVRIEVTTRRHRLLNATPAGSVASPATAPSALSVGAAAPDDAGLAPYSSRGPTPDGRRGVDVVAPPTVWAGPRDGTSAAAAYAAGAAALIISEADTSSPERVITLLCDTAVDVPPAGADAESGYGRLNATGAVERIEAPKGRTEDSQPRTKPHTRC